MYIRILGAVVLLGVFTSGRAYPQSAAAPAKSIGKQLHEVQRRIGQPIPTAEFHEKLPFVKFLELLNKHLSKESTFTVRLDRAAFGKDADAILNEMVCLPTVPSRMNANTALRLTLSQAPTYNYEIEFSAGPSELIITTRDRSMYSETYDIRDIVPLVRRLDLEFKQIKDRASKDGWPDVSWFDSKVDPAKPVDWLVLQIIAVTNQSRAGWQNPKLPSTVRIQNGTNLVVRTAPSVHAEIDQLLHTFRRLADLAVVMNARVYAIDQAEYEKHFASSFMNPRDKSPRLVATVTSAQWKRLESLKPIMESDADKLPPYERADFLNRRTMYQYQAGPGDANPTTAFEGFRFAVRPLVSADRRCLKLEFFYDVEQLVQLTKGTMIDLKTNKAMPIDLPNVRKSQSAGTIEIHDGQAILLAVDYRAKDKVWLVLAEPRIYMEEEEEQIRKGSIKPMPLADAPPEPPEPPVVEEKEPPQMPAVELPNTDDVKQLLQAVLLKVMTDPSIKGPREHYGTPGNGKFTLTNSASVAWPRKFQPVIPGYQTATVDPDECRSFKPRLMGIELRRYARAENKKGGWEANVEVEIFNAGGIGNGAPIRSCPVFCQAKRVNQRWIVECFPGGGWEIVEQRP